MKRTALFPLTTIVFAACDDPTEMLAPPPDRRPVGRLPDDETAESLRMETPPLAGGLP